MLETLFSHKAGRDFARYMSSQNMATQAVDIVGSADDPDLQTTGTAQCIVDGTFVASLTAAALVDLSDADVALPIQYPLANRSDGPQPLAGKVIADNGQFYLLITTNATGGDAGTFVRWAHNSLTAADDVAPTLKIPYYSPDELTIAILLFDNDDASGNLTIGTTNLDYDADATFYQLVGPSLLPAVDMWEVQS
jgi:hypothetical protein